MMLTEIQDQLSRLNAGEIAVVQVPSTSGPGHIKLTLGALSCVVAPVGVLRMLEQLPSNSGAQAVSEAVRHSALHAEQWAG